MPRINLSNEQFEEARVHALFDEGRLDDALRLAEQAVLALKDGGERRLLSEALRARGVALARLGRFEEGRRSIERAVKVAEEAGDPERAGRAAMTIIEELSNSMQGDELGAVYERASRLLASSPNPDTLRRLVACAHRVLFESQANAMPPDWNNFSFRDAVLRYEAGIIEKALKDSGGIVSRAAQLLGMKHHNNLVSILNTRHRELLSERKPIIPRRRSIITRNKPRRSHDADVEEAHELIKK